MGSAHGTRSTRESKYMENLSSTFASQLLLSHCRRKSSDMKESVLSNLNTELDAILQKNDIIAEQFIRNYVRREYFRRFYKWFIVAIAFVCAIYWVPTLNWNATAVGRLALIKVVRPFYNWENLDNERCLIGSSESLAVTDEPSIDANSISLEECSTCENLGKFFSLLQTF